jgi:DNA (cytosine-5)-methyltransferase 1
MKYLSVCSGIEAATVAWHPLGWEPVAFAEVEAFPAAVLAHHYPGVPNLGDMTKINGEQYRDVDVLVGGTPCQAFSIAGLRKGLVDPRGNLTLAFAKLADDMQVPWVVWENVPGVLSSKDNAFGCFLGFLAGETVPLLPPGGRWADAGAVYGPARAIAWRVLDAQYFGLAQRRRRVFVVASAREGFDPAAVLFEFEGVRRDTPPSREAGKTPAGTIEASLGRSRGAGTQAGALTHDVAPCLAASGRGFERAGETRGQDPVVACLNGIAEYRNVSGTLNTNSNPSGRNTPMVVRAFKVRCGCEGGGKGYLGSDDMAFTLSTGADQHVLVNQSQIGCKQHANAEKTRPIEALRILREAIGEEAFCVWSLGIFAELQPAQVLQSRLHGTGFRCATFSRNWVVYCALSRQEDSSAWLLQSLRETECEGCPPQGWGPSEQLTRELGAYLSELSQPGAQATRFMRDLWEASEGAGLLRQALSAVQEVGRSSGSETQSAHRTYAVRRLTVEECEFLQGFPRGYTRIPWRNKPAEDCPDGPRYKALGNSMAVPCMRWIGQRIQSTINHR